LKIGIKKFGILVGVLAALFVLIIPIPVSAANTVIVTISSPTQPVIPGAQFTLNINIQPNNAIAGGQFSLNYDPAILTINSVTEGNLLKQNGASTYFTPGQINNTTGILSNVSSAIISPGQSVSTVGTMTIITCTAGAAKGTSLLSLSNIVIGDIEGKSLTVSVTQGSVVVNNAPGLTSIGNKTVNENALLSFTVSAADADGDSLTYSASNLPSGASFNTSTRVFSWIPGYSQSGTYSAVRFSVSDGTASVYEDISITVNNVNRAPVLSAIGSKSVNEGATLSFTISAADADGDSLTYSASNLPSGASFNTSTRVFSWVPNYSQAGTFTAVHFSVTDGSATSVEDIAITVAHPFTDWDTNQDNSVNVLDLIVNGQHWDESGVTGWIKEDVNHDGLINVLDSIIIGQHWTG
jgi:hypothetical protein